MPGNADKHPVPWFAVPRIPVVTSDRIELYPSGSVCILCLAVR